MDQEMRLMENFRGMMLINALNLHKNVVHSLWKLSKRQNNLIKKHNFSRLFASREEKEDLLDRMRKWGGEIRHYYENWSDWQNELTEDERSKILTLVEAISNVIEDVMVVESENRSLLEKKKVELTEELGTIDFFQECLVSVYMNRN